MGELEAGELDRVVQAHASSQTGYPLTVLVEKGTNTPIIMTEIKDAERRGQPSGWEPTQPSVAAGTETMQFPNARYRNGTFEVRAAIHTIDGRVRYDEFLPVEEILPVLHDAKARNSSCFSLGF